MCVMAHISPGKPRSTPPGKNKYIFTKNYKNKSILMVALSGTVVGADDRL